MITPALPSDADLNRMCAEEMGWMRNASLDYECTPVSATGVKHGESVTRRIYVRDGRACCEEDLPNYTSDSSNDWRLLVHALRKEGWSWIAFTQGDDRYEIQFFRRKNGVLNGEVHEVTDTFSRAIALAFLKVKGKIQ